MVALAQGGCQAVLQSKIEPEVDQLSTLLQYIGSCPVALYESQMCKGVVAATYGCCQTVLQNKIKARRHALDTAVIIEFCRGQTCLKAKCT